MDVKHVKALRTGEGEEGHDERTNVVYGRK